MSPAYAPPPPSTFSPLLAAALVLSALYTAVTARFSLTYPLTTFSERGATKWRLLLTWPYLAAYSKKFRSQFVSALRGQKVKATDSVDGGSE